MEINPLSDVGLVKIFSHSVGCCFVLLTFPLLQKSLSFRRSHLLIIALSVFATEVIFRKWSPVPMHASVLHTFFSMRLSVIGFMLRSLIYLFLSFVHGNRYKSIFILLHVDIQLCQHHLLSCNEYLMKYFGLFTHTLPTKWGLFSFSSLNSLETLKRCQ